MACELLEVDLKSCASQFFKRKIKTESSEEKVKPGIFVHLSPTKVKQLDSYYKVMDSL